MTSGNAPRSPSNGKLTATITHVGRAGLLVDLNSQQQGFIHVSELSKSPEQQSTERFRRGQQVTAWVLDYNPDTARVALTLLDPQSLISINQLRPGQRLEGTVVRIEDYGAFVDVGVGYDGLLHISRLRRIPVQNVSDVVNEGDRVTVWVTKVDIPNQRFDLSQIPPPSLDWRTLQPGQQLSGIVVRIKEGLGAFVDVDAGKDGLVHISRLSSDYVNSVADVVQEGSRVIVWVERVDSKGLSLSMLPPSS